MGNLCKCRSDTDNDGHKKNLNVFERRKANRVGAEVVNSEQYFNYLGELRLGCPAPTWTATAVFGNGDMREISLENYKGRFVVFFFYPMDFTFVCPTEITAFSDRYDEFKQIGCEVIACSTDSKFSHLHWISTPRCEGGVGKLEIPLVADKNCEISRKYGVYKAEDGISWRGLFIIDSEQKLRQITVNDNSVGRSVDETLRLVQAFQYTDKYGEVCPANWKPGEKGIKTDTKLKNWTNKETAVIIPHAKKSRAKTLTVINNDI